MSEKEKVWTYWRQYYIWCVKMWIIFSKFIYWYPITVELKHSWFFFKFYSQKFQLLKYKDLLWLCVKSQYIEYCFWFDYYTLLLPVIQRCDLMLREIVMGMFHCYLKLSVMNALSTPMCDRYVCYHFRKALQALMFCCADLDWLPSQKLFRDGVCPRQGWHGENV